MSRSRSTRRPASKPVLPGGSLLKSKGGSVGVVAKALIAADKTFSRRSKLPDRKHPATGGPLDGRKRLGGAFLIDSGQISLRQVKSFLHAVPTNASSPSIESLPPAV